MSRRGEVLDNARMESRNSTFKMECGERFTTHEVARDETFEYIEVFYNQSAVTRASGTSARRSSRSGIGSGRQSSQTVRGAGSSPLALLGLLDLLGR